MKRQKYGTIFLLAGWLCLGLFAGHANAQSIRTNIDKKEILIGEQIRYELQFVLPSTGYQVEFNVPDSLPHFEILQKKLSDSTDKQGNILKTQQIIFTSWDSGQWTLPAIPMKIRTLGNQAVYSLNADPVTIKVGYMAIDSSAAARDIKTIMEVFYVDREWIWIAVGILLALILGYVLYRYFKKHSKKLKPVVDPGLNAYDEAMKALRTLEGRSFLQQDEIKLFYTDLMYIFKYYYSRRHQKNLLNHTSSEILILMNAQSVNRETVSGVASVLRTADAVKFAKYFPDTASATADLKMIAGAIQTLEKLHTNKT